MKRELQAAFETDPHLHGLDLGGMQKKIKVEVDEQAPEEAPPLQHRKQKKHLIRFKYRIKVV